MSEHPTAAQEREGCDQGEQDLDLPNEGGHLEGGGEVEEWRDDNEEEERSP
jgi:hypothetical protein